MTNVIVPQELGLDDPNGQSIVGFLIIGQSKLAHYLHEELPYTLVVDSSLLDSTTEFDVRINHKRELLSMDQKGSGRNEGRLTVMIDKSDMLSHEQRCSWVNRLYLSYKASTVFVVTRMDDPRHLSIPLRLPKTSIAINAQVKLFSSYAVSVRVSFIRSYVCQAIEWRPRQILNNMIILDDKQRNQVRLIRVFMMIFDVTLPTWMINDWCNGRGDINPLVDLLLAPNDVSKSMQDIVQPVLH
jgi:hypothetical protein